MTHPRGVVLLLILLVLGLGFSVMLHQYLCWGAWFQTNDLHHESFVLACIAMALGIWIGASVGSGSER